VIGRLTETHPSFAEALDGCVSRIPRLHLREREHGDDDGDEKYDLGQHFLVFDGRSFVVHLQLLDVKKLTGCEFDEKLNRLRISCALSQKRGNPRFSD
jgi:hypothetical protein